MPTPARVALVGALGYGITHRKIINQLQEAGRATLVAVCNRRPVQSLVDAPLAGVATFTDHRQMLSALKPDVVVISTPPHSHLAIATDAAEAGCDLLLEKPPVATLPDFAELTNVIETASVACQVGFQALASPALEEAALVCRSGLIGDLTNVTVSGAWWRPDSYYHRSEWAGRHSLAGRPVADGVVANQFSHGIMQALALIEKACGSVDLSRIEVERYRARAVEVEDTACLRLTGRAGPPVVVAVTVSTNELFDGDVTVHGSRGAMTLEYRKDRILTSGTREWRLFPHRPSLLDNLLTHREDPAIPLVAPLSATRPIVTILDALHHLPPPVPVPVRFLSPAPGGDGYVINDIYDVIRRAGREGMLFSELSVPWAHKPHVIHVDGQAG